MEQNPYPGTDCIRPSPSWRFVPDAGCPSFNRRGGWHQPLPDDGQRGGEEAAVAAKHEEEAPRVEAYETKVKRDEESDLSALEDGFWWDVASKSLPQSIINILP